MHRILSPDPGLRIRAMKLVGVDLSTHGYPTFKKEGKERVINAVRTTRGEVDSHQLDLIVLLLLLSRSSVQFTVKPSVLSMVRSYRGRSRGFDAVYSRYYDFLARRVRHESK